MMSRQRNQQGESEEASESLMLVDGFISSPREILLQLMENAFPSIQIPDFFPENGRFFFRNVIK